MESIRRPSRRHSHVPALGAAALLAVALIVSPAAAQAPAATADFSGYATGAVTHADALQTGGTRIVNSDLAFSGASVASKGLGARLTSEVGTVVQPALGDKRTYGRGSGFEASAFEPTPVENDLILTAKVEASAPPSAGPTTQETALPFDPFAYASLLRGRSEARWGGADCVLGADLSFGLGYAAGTQLVDGDFGAPGSSPQLEQPLLTTDALAPERAFSQSLSRTRLVPQTAANGAVLGPNLGLMNETRQTIAPTTLFKGTPQQFTIEVLGEWVLRVVATGLPGGAYVHYGPGAVSPETPILRTIDAAGNVTNILTFQQFLSNAGFVFTFPGLAEIAVGEDPRAIGGDGNSNPTLTPEGTVAAAAVDVVRVKTLFGDLQIEDLRIGHMEARAQVPAGGIACGLGVAKRSEPESVTPGSEFTYVITVTNPYDCTLTDVKVVDTITTTAGINFTVLSQDPSANAVAANTLTWNDVGPIAPGAAKELRVRVRVEPNSASGLFTDRAVATANCGLDSAQAGVKINLQLKGEVVIQLPRVQAGARVLGERILPATGQPVWWLLATAMLLIAAGSATLRAAPAPRALEPEEFGAIMHRLMRG